MGCVSRNASRRQTPDRTSKYVEHIDKYDFSSLRFPVPLSSIGSFAAANNLYINVYDIEDNKKVIYPLRVSQTVVSGRQVDLLLIECIGMQHYTTITIFTTRLVSNQLRNHKCATYCCKKCLHANMTQELLNAHTEDCYHMQRTKFPKDPRCRFTNIQKQLPPPFVVYADFKSILKPVNEELDVTQGVETDIESSSHVFQEHIPCSSAYKIVSSVDTEFSRLLVMYKCKDAAEKFVCELQLEAKQLFDEYIAAPKPMLLTATESRSFANTTICHICTKPLGNDKVRDHCHITGNYHGDV